MHDIGLFGCMTEVEGEYATFYVHVEGVGVQRHPAVGGVAYMNV